MLNHNIDASQFMSSSKMTFNITLLFTLLSSQFMEIRAFSIAARPTRHQSSKIQSTRPFHTLLHSTATPRARKSNRPPSIVTDHDGPTPTFDAASVPVVDPDDILELRDVSDASQLPHPIPHQPWRRGDTAGCEAPITSPWRLQAEKMIYQSSEFAANRPVVLDVTWYLTTLLVTLDPVAINEMDRDLLKARGPVMQVCEPENAEYQDPADPNPPDIDATEDPVMYRRQTPEEAEELQRQRRFYYANKDPDDDSDEPHHLDDQDPLVNVPLYVNEESRADVALHVSSIGQELMETLPQDAVDGALFVDTAKLSTIAQAILDGLESVEEECQVLARHELVLTIPGAPDVIETQKQFDAYRNQRVYVETIDPFNSNRTLRGTLVDRNAMDVIINKRGRMVTIPNNFVKCVRLAGVKAEQEFDEADDE
ncbi:hypothetical protein MPSEU_000171200 [Mayamaea pseudoterrestris]|nr:hypothetical protein MPSEU_000171200 [Mayamaea pseudoterrestris]